MNININIIKRVSIKLHLQDVIYYYITYIHLFKYYL